MPKLTTLLGWGLAGTAGKQIKGRKKKIDTALHEAMYGKKPPKPKGSFKPEGKRYTRK